MVFSVRCRRTDFITKLFAMQNWYIIKWQKLKMQFPFNAFCNTKNSFKLTKNRNSINYNANSDELNQTSNFIGLLIDSSGLN